ncbi:histidine phosphatase family protein [Streptacidiphilus sp. N1-12]|uniref:Histidine phosphatase family protein n=2 Tax=Streptacidiphilus alkalitolerans TaxID=3342712 RepID=A0ABV6VFU8_9ACTN
MTVLEIIFETHATTMDNESGIATGWLPGVLSPTGRLQAADLGARRLGTGVEAVFTSDLERAVETARIAFAGSGLPVHQDSRLRECNYGELNGTPMAALAPLRRRHVDLPFPSGQSYRDVLGATADFLGDLAAGRWPYRSRVLLIAHSANRWALDCLLTGARLEQLVLNPGSWQPGWHYTLTAPAY